MGRIVEVDCWCPYGSGEAVREALSVLKSGGVIVAPTDTLYGIIADASNPKAVLRVYKAKKRPRDKPLPLLLGESHQALLLVRPVGPFWELAQEFWPGPLTIVAPPSPRAPRHLAEWPGIGVRLPDCPLIRFLARKLRGPLTGTSANLSGRESPNTAYEAYSQLGDSVDLYLDGGPTKHGAPSTVVRVREEGVEVLREGAIPAREVERVVRR